MSNQSERSLDSLLSELHKLREKAEELAPLYGAMLEKVAQMPADFGRRWWSSRVNVLLQEVEVDYQKYQAQAEKAHLLGGLMTLAADIALKAGKMEPIPPPASLQVGISISPSGKIEPALFDDPNRQPNVIFITFEEFGAIARRLKEEILKGVVMPKKEDEIPKLIYKLALERK